MMPKIMQEIKNEDQELLIMQEVIRCLKNMGGNGSKKEVVRELKDSAPEGWEEWMDHVTISKVGLPYKDFDYRFGFAVTNLELTQLISRPKRGFYELTEKGRSINLSQFPKEEIKSAYKLEWEKRAKESTSENVKNVIDVEEESPLPWEAELLSALKSFTPQKFELFSRALVKAMGVDIDEKIGVKASGDDGLDGFGYVTAGDFRTSRVAIQAKRWEGTVGSVEIDKFRGAMDKFNAEFGIFITTSSFTRQALEASRTGTRVITLIDGEKIVELVAKFQLYVTPVTTYELGAFYKVAD